MTQMVSTVGGGAGLKNCAIRRGSMHAPSPNALGTDASDATHNTNVAFSSRLAKISMATKNTKNHKECVHGQLLFGALSCFLWQLPGIDCDS
jgi:hypothetical protein